MGKFISFALLISGIISCGQSTDKVEKIHLGEIKITWVDDLTGDYKFKDNWVYQEGVYRNEFGQLSCDGLCPPEIDKMIDDDGKIFKDSLESFYFFIDTTHLYYSIQSETNIDEWAGTGFITILKLNEDTIYCYTDLNAATHCSLNLTIVKNNCMPTVKLNSITSRANTILFHCANGLIQIDQNLWKQNILKAAFDFTFENKDSSKTFLFWKGKIYAKINSKV